MNSPVAGSAGARRPSAHAKILAAALELFNEKGTAAVSTNHIAERAGVSPGNLYYWFDGKSAIIAALFAQWSEESAPSSPADASPAALLAALFATREANDAHAYRYRAIARELLSLLHADEELARQYQRTYRERSAALASMASALVEAGLLRSPEPPDTIDDLVTAAWVLSEFTPPFLQQVAGGAVATGSSRATHAMLSAFLTDEGRRVLSSVHPEERR